MNVGKRRFLKLARYLVVDRPLVLTTVVACAEVFYLVVGSYRYWTKFPFDLHDRWAEIGYFVQRVDPFDVALGKAGIIDWIGNVSEFGGYVPWSYLIAMPLVPPLAFETARLWYYGVMLASFTLSFVLFFRLCRGSGLSSERALLVSAASLCNWAVVFGMRWGQYGLPVLAALLLYMTAIKERRPVIAGLSLATAMIKPQVAILFGFVAVAQRMWKTLLVAVLITVASWTAAAVWIRKPMITLVAAKARLNISTGYYYGVFDGLIRSGNPRETWLLISMITCVMLLLMVALVQRRECVEYHMAVAAVASTMWTYSGVYDALVLGFVVFYLMIHYHQVEHHPFKVVLLGAAALLVWQPSGLSHGVVWPIPLVMRSVWIGAIFVTAAAAKPALRLSGDA